MGEDSVAISKLCLHVNTVSGGTCSLKLVYHCTGMLYWEGVVLLNLDLSHWE